MSIKCKDYSQNYFPAGICSINSDASFQILFFICTLPNSGNRHSRNGREVNGMCSSPSYNADLCVLSTKQIKHNLLILEHSKFQTNNWFLSLTINTLLEQVRREYRKIQSNYLSQKRYLVEINICRIRGSWREDGEVEGLELTSSQKNTKITTNSLLNCVNKKDRNLPEKIFSTQKQGSHTTGWEKEHKKIKSHTH